ncbi:carbohydrate ABC transporter permease [Oceanispirochaeta sp.]|jgi:multiple sugar transport system permease protein|uniref:carbohydrate ABC transporter permease n=1 Tax=Oceanispirochaeta sp. TaxID=2035350 RepID=UPI002609ADAC|nr:carbohydrate ABC transporter permease [Oceanispirochaeta sp.]MDA3955131.1 carbohydrate ABC transporter permease [Oceanispirochaeta sp.]
MKQFLNRHGLNITKYAFVNLMLVIVLFPIYWMLLSSFKTNNQLLTLPPEFIPSSVTLANYIEILGTPKYLIYYKNSLIVTSITVVLTIIISILAGYSFSRYTFKGKKVAMLLVLSVQMFPLVAILISLYTFYAKLHLLNTFTGLILTDITLSLPFAIWFLWAYFNTVPRSLDEAAYIDGCSRMRTLFTIIVPLVKPGLLSVAIYTTLKTWDDFLFSLVIITRDAMRTLPVGIAVSFLGEYVHNYVGMMTVSVAASAPLVILFILLQKNMVSGLTTGSVKG